MKNLRQMSFFLYFKQNPTLSHVVCGCLGRGAVYILYKICYAGKSKHSRHCTECCTNMPGGTIFLICKINESNRCHFLSDVSLAGCGGGE